MNITFDWEYLIVNGKSFRADCKVRNEVNRLREMSPVIYTIRPDGTRQPYMPRRFPSGIWNITGVQWIPQKNSDFYPVIVRTDAKRQVYVWELDEEGEHYIRRTDQIVWDYAFQIHFAWYRGRRSSTTHGCINPYTTEDMIEFAKIVEWVLNDGEPVRLEVM